MHENAQEFILRVPLANVNRELVRHRIEPAFLQQQDRIFIAHGVLGDFELPKGNRHEIETDRERDHGDDEGQGEGGRGQGNFARAARSHDHHFPIIYQFVVGEHNRKKQCNR